MMSAEPLADGIAFLSYY